MLSFHCPPIIYLILVVWNGTKMLILARADRATPPRRAQAASIPQRIRSRSIAGHPGRSGTESVRWKIDIFRVVAALAGLFFVVAVVLMASAPWVLLQPD